MCADPFGPERAEHDREEGENATRDNEEDEEFIFKINDMSDKEVEKFMSSIGDTIKERRRERGMTQEELAKKAGVSDSIISLIERQQRSNMTVATLVRIMAALGGGFEIEHLKAGEVDVVIPVEL